MDKILQPMDPSRSNQMVITNDGATILKSVHIDNAAAKVLVDISKTQDENVGDGTTSVVVLAGELLRQAEKLIQQRIHPMTIIEGWRMAQKAAREALEKSSFDNSKDPQAFRKDLMNIASTTLSSKILSSGKNQFANLAVDAVLRLRGSDNLEHIQIIKIPGGKMSDSYLDEGFILNKKIGVGQPTRLENAKILIANTAMDTDKIKIYGKCTFCFSTRTQGTKLSTFLTHIEHQTYHTTNNRSKSESKGSGQRSRNRRSREGEDETQGKENL